MLTDADPFGHQGSDTFTSAMSFQADLKAMTAFEIALVQAQAQRGEISQKAALHIADVVASTRLDTKALADGYARDGVVVPALVAAWRTALLDQHKDAFHKGATSQDLVDTSLMIRAKVLVAAWDQALGEIAHVLSTIMADHGLKQVMARTRMQDAMAMPLTLRVQNWHVAVTQLRSAQPQVFPVQMGGPDGTGRSYGGDVDHLRADLADRLQLSDPQMPWHTNRAPVLDLGSWCTSVTGALGKIGQDITIMAQNAIAEARLEGGGTSSAMPHKNNPIAAEWMVAIARQNAGLLGTLHQAQVAENERSGAAWTLEWLTLPAMFAATDCALHKAKSLLDQARF
ncbi:MAG: lyase family protein [Pseudomonadota bacterium]